MNETKSKILDSVKKYIEDQEKKTFIPGETYIPTSGATWDASDIAQSVEVLLEMWYDGKTIHDFERLLAGITKQRHVSMCNSGSSASLLAISALMSKSLGERRLKPGDEVITVAAGFPTTVNPIVQNGLVPVFIDINLPQYNALPNAVEEAISDKTKAVYFAHTLGNPFKARDIRDLCDRNELWFVSDNCDALGAENHGEPLAHWADISTYSFYPAHHVSTMEGGAVSTNNPRIKSVAESLRGWGRDCWCHPGHDNTCGKRYDWQLGELPYGFDHKYIFSEIGYNLKSTDIMAALGLNQLKRLNQFVSARNENWQFYRDELEDLKEFFILPEPAPYSKPSWFGFMATVKDSAPFSRRDVVTFLEENRIGSRMLFAGNLIRHPAYQDVKYRVSDTLVKTDKVMNNGFWIGVYQGITSQMREYVVDKLHQFCRTYK